MTAWDPKWSGPVVLRVHTPCPECGTTINVDVPADMHTGFALCACGFRGVGHLTLELLDRDGLPIARHRLEEDPP